MLLSAPHMSPFGLRLTVEQQNVAPPCFRATVANANRASHSLEPPPPLPPTSMLRPSGARQPRWCNIFCFEMPFLSSVPTYTNIESRGDRGEV